MPARLPDNGTRFQVSKTRHNARMVREELFYPCVDQKIMVVRYAADVGRFKTEKPVLSATMREGSVATATALFGGIEYRGAP